MASSDTHPGLISSRSLSGRFKTKSPSSSSLKSRNPSNLRNNPAYDYLIPKSATIQIPAATHPSLLLTTPSYKVMEQSTSIVSFPSDLSASLERSRKHAYESSSVSKRPRLRSDRLRIVESTSLDLSNLQEAHFNTLLTSYSYSPPPSLSSFPTLSSHDSMALSLSDFPSPPSTNPWESAGDVQSMLSQLEQIARELKGMDNHNILVSVPSTKSQSTLSALSWTSSTSNNWLASLQGSFSHSLAHLREGMSTLDVEKIVHAESKILLEPTKASIPRIIVTLPSLDSVQEVTDKVEDAEEKEQGVATAKRFSRISKPMRRISVLTQTMDHLSPIARPSILSTRSRVRPLSLHGAPAHPALWLCDIVAFPLELHPWGRGEAMKSRSTEKPGKANAWPALSADRTAVKSFFDDDKDPERVQGVWQRVKKFLHLPSSW